ncbi:hypothetical protein ACFQLX_19355 [Streptomyces polyrhachis]|uniref:Aminodeoxyfutalosine deaminase/Imidazolonepropionase-like composite domain-containing protein n=1 Tax=Streptomyces polyrhachis TaxID=1282885 RepID=A0ABW2GHW5_9ACTN
MRTLHAADAVRPGDGTRIAGGAVLVEGRLIAAVGPYGELAAPGVRVRRWPGTIAPGAVLADGRDFLEGAYHPDPREAGELGTAPLTGDALAKLAMDDARWGASARRGLQRLLARGTVRVGGAPPSRPAVREALRRSGMGAVAPGELRAGEPATFAVFEEAADAGSDTGPRCVATVLGGRLVHRLR